VLGHQGTVFLFVGSGSVLCFVGFGYGICRLVVVFGITDTNSTGGKQQPHICTSSDECLQHSPKTIVEVCNQMRLSLYQNFIG